MSQHPLQPVINRIVPIRFERGLQALSPAERNVFLVWCYPAAVNDGGHASFFYNTQGEFAHETVQALEEIGAPEYGKLLDRAIDLFPDRSVPRDIEERNAALSALPDDSDERLEKLDDEFYALGDDELLSRLTVYWNRHNG